MSFLVNHPIGNIYRTCKMNINIMFLAIINESIIELGLNLMVKPVNSYY